MFVRKKAQLTVEKLQKYMERAASMWRMRQLLSKCKRQQSCKQDGNERKEQKEAFLLCFCINVVSTDLVCKN